MRRPKTDRPVAWHVFARGARRLALFHKAGDSAQFIAMLRYALEASGCIIFAYCLMTNHFHLMLKGTTLQLTACMRRLDGLYSRYHNLTYDLSGHAFDGPFKAYIQTTWKFMLRRIAYIFLNPVTAGIVDRPEDWRWSGFQSFMGRSGSPLPVDPIEPLIHLSSDLVDARSQFMGVLAREQRRPKRPSKDRLSAVDLQADQLDWIRDMAKQCHPDLDASHLENIVLAGALQVGIFPRVIARGLGLSAAAVRNRMSRLRARQAADPDLSNRLAL